MYLNAATKATTYSQKETFDKLEISKDALVRLRDAGIIPYQQIGPYVRYERTYIDGLAATLQLAKLGRTSALDTTLLELYYIRYTYSLATPRQRVQLRQHCRGMVENGKAFTLVWLMDELQHYYPESTVRKWARTGKIACVAIHRTYYLSMRYVRRLVWLLTVCLVTNEAADKLQRHYKSIYNYIKNGQLIAIKGPDGKLRIDPAQLPAVQQDGLTVPLAAAALGISTTWLWQLINKKRVRTSLPAGRELRIPVEEFEKWRTQFTTLNSGFEWLQQYVASQGSSTPVLAAKQVVTRLDITFVTLMAWTRAGFLPYFICSFDGVHQSRLYVKGYIDGLQRFTRPHKVTKTAAWVYYQACARNRMIM